MSFQNLDENQIDWTEWQNLYLDTRATNRGFRQILLVGIPFLLITLWVTFFSLLLSYQFGYAKGLDATASFFSRAITWSRVLLPAIMILLGLYVLLAIGKTFTVGLYHPDSGSESEVKTRIWHRFWGWYGFFSFPNYEVVNNTKLEESIHWSTWLGGPTFLIIYDGFAVYLERGNSFSRVVGAGFPVPYLDARETIKAVVDLRPQVREANANAWTNDGIKVTVKVRVEFQIDPGPAQNSGDGKLVYPFNPLVAKAVQKAVEFTAVRMREGKLEEVGWCDGTMGNITGLLAHHISSYHFDELFMRNEGNGQILSQQAMNALLQKANQHLGERGVKITSMQIVEVSIPSGIREQRVDVWGAGKDSLVTRIRGEAQAYKIRVNEEARAKAQRDLILAITKSLGRVDPSHFPESLLLSLSGILDQSLGDPLVQTYMARGTLDALKSLKELLYTDGGEKFRRLSGNHRDTSPNVERD